jgi:hypothetical protein
MSQHFRASAHHAWGRMQQQRCMPRPLRYAAPRTMATAFCAACDRCSLPAARCPLLVARCSSQRRAGASGQSAARLRKLTPSASVGNRLQRWNCLAFAASDEGLLCGSFAQTRYDCVSFRLLLDGPCVVGSARQRQRWSGRSASHAFCSTSSVRLAKTPAATTYSGIDYYSRLQTTARDRDLLSSTFCLCARSRGCHARSGVSPDLGSRDRCVTLSSMWRRVGRSRKSLPAYFPCCHTACRVIGRPLVRDESLCHSALRCEQRITRSSRATQ